MNGTYESERMTGERMTGERMAQLMKCAFVVVFCLTGAAAVEAQPCTTATPDCTEWIKPGAGSSRTLIYRNHPLEAKNERITRALVMIHGAGRDADNYFRSALASAFLAGALEDAIVIAPRIASNNGSGCRDELAPGEVNWNCSSWRSGGAATNDGELTSYDLADAILGKLARRETFPNLKAIVLCGHSAGGQYVTRYVMASRVHGKLGVPVTYIVSNPSSYAYLDSTRPVAGADEWKPFADQGNCANYDRWPYGLQNRQGYTAKMTDDELRKNLAARPVTYLLGGLDTLPLAGFDSSCSAMAQGANRYERGESYAKYVNQKFDARHTVTPVPLCGHNARCMFTAEQALPLLFPKH